MTQLDTPITTNGTPPEAAPDRQLSVPQRMALAPPTDDGQFANLLDASRFAQVQRVAQLFASSQMVPAHFQGSTANCFIALQMAMRMGVDPFMFMQNTYIVHGRPGMEAKLAIALINSSGLFENSLDYEVSGGTDPFSQPYRVRAFATRRGTGKVIHGPWIDWDLVRKEGWDKAKGGQPSKWTTMPGIMFPYRAAMFFGRLHCPERLMGMQTADELEDIANTAPGQTLVGPSGPKGAAALLNKLRDAGQTIDAGEAQAPAPTHTVADADFVVGGPPKETVEAADGAPDLEADIDAALSKPWRQVQKVLDDKAKDRQVGISDRSGGFSRFVKANGGDGDKIPLGDRRRLYDAILAGSFDYATGKIIEQEATAQ